MANGLNRLEKLFSKKKASPVTTDSTPQQQIQVETSRPSAGEDATFPAPSFLRPKGSRMIARDETAANGHYEQRAQSLPESLSERVSMHSPNPSTASTSDIKRFPARSTSLVQRKKQLRHASSLAEFRFPMPPTRISTELSPTSSRSEPISPRASFSPRSGPIEHRHSCAIVQTRLHTPPASDHEDDLAGNMTLKMHSFAPSTTIIDLPTPAASPELKASATQLTDTEMLLAQKRSKFAPLRRRKEEKAAGLRRAQSHANILSSSTSPPPTKILQGVNVTDFFDLDDDDLAEEVPETENPDSPQRPDGRGFKNTLSPYSRRSSLATVISDPLADARAHGAVQAAKIAAKHKFDLVYIVNLWPEEQESSPQGAACDSTSSRRSSSSSSLLGSTDGTVIETAAGMTGRLLAAYGLSKVASPFRISAAVHAKILRHESWIEYRGHDAKQHDFSRGYGHAFHTGVRRKAGDGHSTDNTISNSRAGIERGIVFAAYRQPGPDGKTKGCTQAELKELHADAEYLIEMLIAIHKAKRRRHPRASTMAAHSMGPIPPQAEDVFA